MTNLDGVMAKANPTLYCQSVGRGLRPYQLQTLVEAGDWLTIPKHAKSLSPRRTAEFRGRYLRKIFGTRKQRAHRWQLLVKLYGVAQAQRLSSNNPWPIWYGYNQNDTAL